MRDIYFSIVIPTFNRAGFIEETIKSVINQSYGNWECIIVDDGSFDDTSDILKKIIEDEPRVKYIYQKNSERCIARNNGIENAKGKYICFLDSDDTFLENHLEVLFKNITDKQQPKALFFTNALMKDNLGKITERLCPEIKDKNVQDYILNYTFNPARVAIHKDILQFEKFDINIPGLEDLELWLRISLKFDVFQINERTIIYNLHDDSYTIGDANRYEKELKYFKYIFKKIEFRKSLKRKSKNRLLSMCYFHLSNSAFDKKLKIKTLSYSLKSFILFPFGYNGKTNKIILNNIVKILFK